MAIFPYSVDFKEHKWRYRQIVRALNLIGNRPETPFLLPQLKKFSQNFQFFYIFTVELKPIELTANYELYRRLGLLVCEANIFWTKKINQNIFQNTGFNMSYCTCNNSQYWRHSIPVKWSPNLVLWDSFVNQDLACICVYELWPAGKKGRRRFFFLLTRYFENIDQISQSKQKSTLLNCIWCLGSQICSDTWPYFLRIHSFNWNRYVLYWEILKIPIYRLEF